MSKLFSLDYNDFFNGLVMAVLGNVVLYLLAIFSELYQLVLKGDPFVININWEAVLVIGIFSALTYLSKRLISNKNGDILTK